MIKSTLYFSFLVIVQHRTLGFLLQDAGDCDKGEFFDTASLRCRSCPIGQTLTNGRCICDTNTILTHYSERTSVSGSLCSARCDRTQNEVSSETGKYCVYCDPTTGYETVHYRNGTTKTRTVWTPSYVTEDGRCKCVDFSNEYTSTEIDAYGSPLRDNNTMVRRCLRCPSGAAVLDGSCEACAFPRYFNETTSQCECMENLSTPIDCFDSTKDENLLLDYLEVNTTGNKNGEYFGTIGRRCLVEDHLDSCNALANECVMQFYDRETLECELYNAILSKKYDPSGSAVAMDYFSTIWGRNIPWIYYTDTLSMWKQRTDLNLKISKQWSDDGPSDGDHLSLILSSYFRNGTWKEFLEVSDELQLCKGAISDSQAWKIPTTNFVNSCKLHSSTLETVLQFHEDTLYELFLLDENKSLYPIPVKQTKVQNSDFIQTGDQSLSRRFFLAQNMSTSGTHWLCANEIRLDLYLTPSGVLQPPIMHIDYTRVSDLRSSKHHSVSFKLSYRSHPPVSALFRSHFRTAIVASIVSTLFIGLALILREARARQPRALTTNFFCFAIACLSNVLSLTLTATLIHIVVFFWLFGVHFRSDFKILAADSEEFEHSVLSIAIGALVSRILSVAYSVYQQVTYDLYFIDWENPRRIIDFESGMEINAPVSCWRRLLVANEWNELETRRRHPVHHTILLVILLLEGIATWRGVTEDLYREESGIIRLGRVLAVYALVLCGQLIWNRIESTCIKENPLSQFVDLLFISNISCLMMDTSFSGYYLHGRNQNLHSDVSLKELNDSLVQEHHGLLAQRGLSLLNNQDHQVFKCFISTEVYQSLQGSTNGRELDQEKSWTPRTPLSALNSQKLEFSPETLIQKMIREIENNISEQVVYQPLLNQWCTSRPDLSFKRSILLADDYHSFQKLILQGIELQLCSLEILIFVLLDAWLKNIIISSFLVVVITSTLTKLRAYFGQINICRKTNISRNFLI